MRSSTGWKWVTAAVALALTSTTAYFVVPLSTSPEPAEPAAASPVRTTLAHVSSPSGGAGPNGRAASRPNVRSVLTVSIDGLNPDALTELGPSRTPNLHKLLAKGASTLNARTEFEATQTLPNHTGMVTGRPVDTDIGGHGVWFNEDNGSTVHKSAGERVRSAFSVVHNRLGRTALFASKDKFDFLDRSWPEAIDKYRMIPNNKALTRAVLRDLRQKRRSFRFVHYSAPDVTGHASGYLSEDYLAAVEKTDHRLGRLMKRIKKIPRLRRHLVLIVTSDHGGLGLSHSDETAAANYTVPFFVWGRGIDQADLYDLNPAYADPGGGRASYSGDQPIRNGAVANLVTQLLGIRSVPGSLFNESQSLEVYSD
jgi:predicted AlkP superfamily pyrophosphatase or phosphodiesterase